MFLRIITKRGETMLYSYEDCKLKFGNDYQIQKVIEKGDIYKISPGIYSDKPNPSEIEIVSFKYPKAVFTSNSAFYYHSLTDTIPEQHYLGTPKDSAKITDINIKQVFYRDNVFGVGVTEMEYQNTTIKVYDLERMLIELIRNKKKMPFDLYKEIIENYRKRIDSLDIEKLQDYIAFFPKQNHIFETIQLEVF